ncbi:MAG TPA: IS1595 family transposase [Terriglobales bacterium]
MPTSINGTTLTLLPLIEKIGNEDNARKLLESVRWPEGPICPHCGELDNATAIKPRPTSKKPARKGLWQCRGCREQFTVTVGTVFEDSHIPLHRWLLAAYLLCASKKGMSAHQIHRMTGMPYKTVWFMMHRLRFAMTQHGMFDKLRGIVEIDEVWIGPRERGRAGIPGVESKKRPVVSLMERSENGAQVRSFHVERVTLNNIKPILREHVEVGTNIQTDEATVYHFIHDEFPDHDVVTHKDKQYSYRTPDGRHVTTNTVEGFFGLVKRGVFGVYHHWGRGYMQQYLNEFDFRYNNRKMSDSDRTFRMLKAIEGKRLTLREPRRLSA